MGAPLLARVPRRVAEVWAALVPAVDIAPPRAVVGAVERGNGKLP